MNDRQRQVIAAAVCGLLLIIMFLCPWRVESTGELEWSPIYQPPMSYVRSYNNEHGTRGSSRIVSEEAHIAYDFLVLEVLALAAAGGLLYFFAAGSGEEEQDHKTVEY